MRYCGLGECFPLSHLYAHLWKIPTHCLWPIVIKDASCRDVCSAGESCCKECWYLAVGEVYIKKISHHLLLMCKIIFRGCQSLSQSHPHIYLCLDQRELNSFYRYVSVELQARYSYFFGSYFLSLMDGRFHSCDWGCLYSNCGLHRHVLRLYRRELLSSCPANCY